MIRIGTYLRTKKSTGHRHEYLSWHLNGRLIRLLALISALLFSTACKMFEAKDLSKQEPTVNATAASTIVKGSIGAPSEDSGYIYIPGWACQVGLERSINVHLKVRNADNSLTQIANIVASNSNEVAVNDQCGTQSTSHRFRFQISKQILINHRGKPIVVYGIKANNQAVNAMLWNSDSYSISNFTDQRITGHLDRVSISGQNISFGGWACQHDVNQSLNVHVYVGGAAGQGGTYVGQGPSDQSHEQGVSDRCGNTSVGHRFNFTISMNTLSSHRGKDVYVHGISKITGYTNLTIMNSGNLQIPNFTRQLNLSQIPKTGNDTIIYEDVTATIDANHSTRVLNIQGKLNCPTSSNRTITADAILVSGELNCGSSAAPVNGKIRFQLGGNYEVVMGGHSMGIKTFAVLSGGTLKLYGNEQKSTWSRLSRTINPGDSTIKISHDVSWAVGDQLAIAPTEYNASEAEEVTITRVISTREFEVNVTNSSDGKFRYSHYGKNHKYGKDSEEWTLVSKAEVANLTRNIVIETEEDMRSTNLPLTERYIGAHMMVMRGGYAEVNAVEFKDMGQAGEMARYPFHWHRAGNVPNQFIKNSSVHHSFQRCITVHSTNQALVENNVCFDHRGHGIFLEDGSEVNNTIIKNLVILSRRPYDDRVLLESDHIYRNLKPGQTTRENTSGKQTARFIGPSSFWISNPKNTIEQNVSSGTEGTGFWMSFENRELCNDDECSHPSKERTTKYSNNLAKSCVVGHTWDGAMGTTSANNALNDTDMLIESVRYEPDYVPRFNNLKALKCKQSGFYTRSRPMEFVRAVTADTPWHHFHAFNIRIIRSVMIGKSPNFTASSKLAIADRVHSAGHYGIILYDGPFELDQVHFADFSTTQEFPAQGDSRDITATPIGTIGGFNKYTNRASGLSFSPEPFRRADFRRRGNGWDDHHVVQSLLDLDGSLTTVAGSMVVYKHSFNRKNGCVADDNTQTYICPPTTNYFHGTLRINDMDRSSTNPNPRIPHFWFNTIRNNAVETRTEPDQLNFHNKVNMITNGGNSYEIDFENQTGNDKRITWYSEFNGQASPTIKITGIQDTCSLEGATLKSNINQVNSATSTAYYRSGKDLHIKIFPNTIDDKFTNGYINSYFADHYLDCN